MSFAGTLAWAQGIWGYINIGRNSTKKDEMIKLVFVMEAYFNPSDIAKDILHPQSKGTFPWNFVSYSELRKLRHGTVDRRNVLLTELAKGG